MDNTRYKTHTKADEGNYSKSQKKGSRGNHCSKGSYPTNASIDEKGHILKKFLHSHRNSLKVDEPTNKADAKTDKSDDNESEDKGVLYNDSGILTNPSNGRGHEGGNSGQDSSKSNSFSLKNHLIKKNLKN